MVPSFVRNIRTGCRDRCRSMRISSRGQRSLRYARVSTRRRSVEPLARKRRAARDGRSVEEIIERLFDEIVEEPVKAAGEQRGGGEGEDPGGSNAAEGRHLKAALVRHHRASDSGRENVRGADG